MFVLLEEKFAVLGLQDEKIMVDQKVLVFDDPNNFTVRFYFLYGL